MTQTDVIRMIRGSQPVFTNEAINYLYCRGLGHWVGGHVDEWRWNDESDKCWNLNIWDLLNIYRDYCEHKEGDVFDIGRFIQPLPEIPPLDPNTKVEEIKLEGADKFNEELEKHLQALDDKFRKAIEDGSIFEKPYFRARRKDFTEVYECDEYKCDAHPNGCMFCKHSTDVFYDYTNGPYMIVCDGNHSTKKGFIGKCKHFER